MYCIWQLIIKYVYDTQELCILGRTDKIRFGL